MSHPQQQSNKHCSKPAFRSQSRPSSSAHGRLSFMDLPLEIRKMVYSMALISPTPLIAWSGMPLPELVKSPFALNMISVYETPHSFYIDDYLKNALPVERLMVSLSLVSRNISSEIARVFWSYNTFRFIGEWIWDTVLEWLIRIGSVNRSYITRLEFQMFQLQHVWQLSEPIGARTQLALPEASTAQSWQEEENRREIVYPLSRHLIRPESKTSTGFSTGDQFLDPPQGLSGAVENISPKMEVVMKMLARAGKWTKVRLTMLLPSHLVPGVQMWGRGSSPSQQRKYWMSMDLPNVIESCIATHAVDGSKQIEVLWKCKERGMSLQDNKHLLQEQGWEIIYTRHEDYCSFHRDWDTFFTMKRKEVHGPFIASDPSPHSEAYLQE
ncbi:uncharacterized protein LY89DRAFT_200147 [Mollisia scopiformis]|uniref:F-box domain-containing protein n=1 Tax=Mollisia scopiformis TaxID=149040 RepID=A0A194WYN1_MOLSC|nr:uncharacterized protein LY89DRAFT_200147 [Mollisia scopiformis]KUJ13055.1 hypothetical protein LY89DRAFT_200147 [Mollisia scopiformis]